MYVCVSMSVMMSGSLTYGAACGTCGLAVLGVFFRQIESQRRCCSAGLFARYGNCLFGTAPWAAIALLLAMLGLLFSQSIQSLRAKVLLGTGAVAVGLLVNSVAFVDFRSELAGRNAYGATNLSVAMAIY